MNSLTSLQLLAFNYVKKKACVYIQRQNLLNKATKCILYSTWLKEIMNRQDKEVGLYLCHMCLVG